MLKMIGWLALAVFAVYAAFFAAWTAIWLFNFHVVSPWLYERTTRAANAANDANWADGTAMIYTLEARIEIGDETFTATSELTCAPKSFTRPMTLKNEREYRRGVWGFAAEPLSIRFPDGSRVDFPYGSGRLPEFATHVPAERFSKPSRRHGQLRSRRGGNTAGRSLQRCSLGGPRRHRRDHDLSGLGGVDAGGQTT